MNQHNAARAKLTAVISFFILPFMTVAQSGAADSTLQEITLKAAIDYSIKHQPTIRQSIIDEKLTENAIRSKLADWYPQVNFNYNLQHNFITQTSIIAGNPVKLGVDNTSSGQFTASQTIFNKDVLLAKRTKADVRLQASQSTARNKIELAAEVSKAFYDILTTMQQIKVADANIVRIERSLKDATSQYKAGVADKIDYKRATINLNNAKASKRSNEELLIAKTEKLRALMSYPESATMNIVYDSLQMEKEIVLDTLQFPDYKARIEYKVLETQMRLLKANLLYNKWSYLPSVSANGTYNLNFQNDNFVKLYGTNYPNAFAAITLTMPIFQGGKRKINLETAQWQLKRNEQDIIKLKDEVNAEYQQALAEYKSNLANYLALKDNMVLAKEVYDVVQLQYRSGIKAYIEVITSETDLRTAQINYYNALYQVLSSKIDVLRALGQISY